MTAGEDFFVIGHRPLTEAEATCRYIFLDFDGAKTRPGVAQPVPVPSEAKLNAESIERILATLNDVFAAQQIRFVNEEPEASYHTIQVDSPDPDKVIDINAVVEEPDPERKLIESIAARAEEMLKAKQRR